MLGLNVLLPGRPGAKHPLRRNDQGRNDQGRNVLWIKRPGGKSRLAEDVVWGETTRILDGKIVTCFTHYKVSVRQTLELIKVAFRKP